HGVVVLRGLLPAAQALATADSDLGVALRAGVLRAGGAAAGVPVEPFGATDGAEPAAGGLWWPVCLGAGTWALEPCAGGGWGREDRRIHESHAVVHWFAGGAAAGRGTAQLSCHGWWPDPVRHRRGTGPGADAAQGR